LPIYPLLFIWLSQTINSRSRWIVLRTRPTLLLLGLWYAAGSLWIAPHYLAYFNELCGGPRNGYRLLNESNFDWGQELRGLSSYLHQHGIKRIQLGYFGTADPAHYGIAYGPLPRDREKALRAGGLVAVSATLLNNDYYSWLRQMEPVDRIGYTIFIYDLSRTSREAQPSAVYFSGRTCAGALNFVGTCQFARVDPEVLDRIVHFRDGPGAIAVEDQQAVALFSQRAVGAHQSFCCRALQERACLHVHGTS
jgi:hypothetical protein